MRRVLFVVNDPAFFISHRLSIACAAKKEGYEVHVATAPGDSVSTILGHGFVHHPLPLSRSGINIFREFFAFISIWAVFVKVRPTIAHLVTIKPVLYGGLAARISPVKGVVAALSGLGFIYIRQGKKAGALKMVVSYLYRLAFAKSNLKAIFQNADDMNDFVRQNIVPRSKAVIIRGSGVDLSLFEYRPEPDTVPMVTFAARLLRDKGVVEYVKAASLLKLRGVSANFQVVGGIDTGNPTSITRQEIDAWRSEGFISFLGHRRDISSIFSRSHIIVLPSYREGLPKVLVEAAACGRAVVTCDVPGCRDAIEPGVTGLLVPERNAGALAESIQLLVENSELRQRFGRAGRDLAEREFGIAGIVRQHLDIYQELGALNE